jgi:hypothetical protein
MPDIYYNIKALIRNLPLFLRLAWNWRKWDSHYTIDVLVVLIREHAKDQLADKHHLHHVKRYRTAMIAARLIEQAYGDYRHLSEKYIDSKREYCLENNKVIIKYSGDAEMLDKMIKVAYAKASEIKKERKAYAWAYLNKHIERMWS